MQKKTLSIILVGLAIILLSVFLYFLYNSIIYKGGIFNKVVHAEYKEKFDIKEHISFVFLGSKDDIQLVGAVNTQKKGLYDVNIKYHDELKPLTVEVSDTKSPTLRVRNYKTDKFEKVVVSHFTPKVKDADSIDKIKMTLGKEEPTEKSGEYEVKITAEDSSGNKTHKIAKLNLR